jgi:hypothetical protein
MEEKENARPVTARQFLANLSGGGGGVKKKNTKEINKN